MRGRCLGTSERIDLEPDEKPWDLAGSPFLSRHGVLSIPDATARLLGTPRALKHSLRQTYQAWKVLQGEVDFDHLLGVNILRFGAPEAFDFLLRNWKTLHDDSGTQNGLGAQPSPVEKRLTSEWKRLTRGVEWDTRSAKRILMHLLPSARPYLGESKSIHNARLQGIGLNRYLLRIVNEDIDPLQTRDQQVLRDIADWQAKPRAASRLIECLSEDNEYVSVFHHFALRSSLRSPGAILELTDHFLRQFRTPWGVRIPEESGLDRPVGPVPSQPSFQALLDLARRSDIRGQSRDWLERQVNLAFESSLALVNDLYLEWASTYRGVVSQAEDRHHIRRIIHDLARSKWKHGDDVLRVTHPRLPYNVYRIVNTYELDDQPSIFQGLKHWDWIGPILLEALRIDSTRIALDVGGLVSKNRMGEDRTTKVHLIDQELLDGFFGIDADEVITLLSSALQYFAGYDRVILEQIVHSAVARQESVEDGPGVDGRCNFPPS